jgi:hypothetical protein
MGHPPDMARKLRLQYPGAIYHLMSRGDRREPVFLEDADRSLFVSTLGEACAKTDWQVQEEGSTHSLVRFSEEIEKAIGVTSKQSILLKNPLLPKAIGVTSKHSTFEALLNTPRRIAPFERLRRFQFGGVFVSCQFAVSIGKPSG